MVFISTSVIPIDIISNNRKKKITPIKNNEVHRQKNAALLPNKPQTKPHQVHQNLEVKIPAIRWVKSSIVLGWVRWVFIQQPDHDARDHQRRHYGHPHLRLQDGHELEQILLALAFPDHWWGWRGMWRGWWGYSYIWGVGLIVFLGCICRERSMLIGFVVHWVRLEWTERQICGR